MNFVMSTLEIKQELHDFINQGDDKSIKQFYKMAKDFILQLQKDKMIAEGEADIKAGRLHSQEDIKSFINNWKV